jgi:hypothetical protein
MRDLRAGVWIALAVLTFTIVLLVNLSAHNGTQNRPTMIPRSWDDQAMATLELPLATAGASPVPVSAEYYYRIPVRPIYKTYPVYHPDQEPSGYFARLKVVEPEILSLDFSKVTTADDWIRIGEMVFDTPIDYDIAGSPARFRDASYYTTLGIPIAHDGTVPFVRYVVREKGKVEVGVLGCGTCHTRVMPDGSVVKGAQGNFPFDRTAPPDLPEAALPVIRRLLKMLYAVPWLGERDPARRFETMTYREMLEHGRAIPPGVQARHGTGLHMPAQIPDLIGVQDRRYLDHTGLVRHRDIVDLMRYAALNQSVDLYSKHGNFVPVAQDYRTAPEPTAESPFPFANGRYSDEQLYALAQFVYSLQPPINPNAASPLTRRGQEVFARAGCRACHTPPLYTNNKLIPVQGFRPAATEIDAPDVMTRSVGTNPDLALRTRRGTGYYKVPSLKGVWYRGPLEHSGSVATLEDWFDPRRLRDDYVPTGWKGHGVKTRAVKGHEFGLTLSPSDKHALIAFLKTL